VSIIELAGGLLFGFGGWLVAAWLWTLYRVEKERCERYIRLHVKSLGQVLQWQNRAETAEQITAAMHAAEEWTE